MTDTTHPLPPALASALADLLRRYRRHRLLRACLRILLISFVPALLAIALWALDAPVSPASLFAGWAGITAVIGAFVLWPVLRRPLTLRDVARQVDRCHPELKDRLMSAVALTEARGEVGTSPWMLSAFFSDAERQVAASPLDRVVQPADVRRAALLSGLCVLLYLVTAGGLWLFTYGLRAVEPGGRVQVSARADLTVEPGDTAVLAGERVLIWATGDDTESLRRIHWEAGGQSGSAAMSVSSTPRVTHHAFGAVSEDITYWVEAGPQSSPRYTITVNVSPALESLQLHYEYPDYLAREPRTVPFGGDIAGVEGTVVTLTARTNKPVADARLVYTSGGELALEAAGDGQSWTASMALSKSARYHVALRDEGGMENQYPDEYAIDVQPDLPPAITVRQPRGDGEVLALEEVDFAFAVEDDFGIAGYGIQYTIAGQEPVRLALNDGPVDVREVVGGHLLALEELGVSPGDLITWAVWAEDRKPDRKPFEIMSDPYFLEVRPYTRRFREQLSQAGQGGESGPSVDQRQIVIALWNLRKSASTLEEEAFSENKEKIRAAQRELREQSEGAMGSGMGDAAILEAAVEAMLAVEEALAGAALPEPEEALTEAAEAAQAAFHHLLRLAPEERQIARTEGASQGGGAAQQEINELEMSRRKDYQEEARTGQAAAVAENEALRAGLEELARRQEVLNEDMGKTLAEDGQLSEEERRRRLERLEMEQKRQLESLDKLARDVASSSMTGEQREAASSNLEEAREGMESSLESVRREALQQARAAGSRAGNALEAAEEDLARLTREGAREAFDGMQEDWARLAERHRALETERDALRAEQSAPGVTDATTANTRLEQFEEDRSALADDTRGLLEEAGALSDRVRQEQAFFSRKLGEWVRETSRTGVVEDMLEVSEYAQYGMWDAAGMADARVREKLDEAQEELEALAQHWSGDPATDMERAIERLAALEESLGGGEAGDPSPTGGEPGEGASSGAAGSTPGTEGGSTAADSERDAAAPGRGAPGGGEPGDDAPSETGEGGQGEAALAQNGAPGDTPGGEGDGTSGPQGGGSPDGATPGERGGSASPAGGILGGGGRGATSGGGDFGGGDLAELFDRGTWRGELSDAVALLPRDSRERSAVEEVGLNLGLLQRAYEASKALPDPSEFEQVVRRPLREAIAQLETAVARARDGGTRLEDEGAVPDQYVDRVAEYFRLLAESAEGS